MGESFRAYLRAKRTVDDRAIDRRVFERLRRELRGRERLRVLDVGAGLGAMCHRLVEWEALPPRVEYTLVDREASTLVAAREELPGWARERGFDVADDGERLVCTRDEEHLSVEFVAGDALAVAPAGECDLLVGQAFLDLVEPDALPDLLTALDPGGLWYFPITYDGGTHFSPPHPDDDAVERAYHDHMDARPKAGRRAGRSVYHALPDSADLLAAAGSDWVVYPREGGYPAEEATFLRWVLDAVEGALREDDALAPAALDDWVETRREQVAAGDLVYVAHQLDLLGRVR